MFAPLKTQVRLRPRVRWDDDEDECDCPPCPPGHEPLWQALLVALTPVVLTGVLELYIEKRKRAMDAEAAKKRPRGAK